MANAAAERSRSVWMEQGLPRAAPLGTDATCDVVVIGAGIAGLSVAYEAVRRGQSVVVLDRGGIGGGMTARTSAHLASDWDDGYAALQVTNGSQFARIIHESHAAAIDRIEAIVAEERIDCDFARIDGYVAAAAATDPAELDKELAACRKLDIDGVELVGRAPLGGPAPALRFARQGRFRPLKYVGGLAAGITRRGAQIFGDTTVNSVEESRDGVVVTTTAGHRVHAGAAVVATGSPINDKLKVHTKQVPWRSYCLAAAVPKGSVADALYCDTARPYHYVRIQPRGRDDLLIVGGEDHKTGAADDGEARLVRLAAWAKHHFPTMGQVEYRWSGQVLEPGDQAGFIGLNPGDRRIYIVIGDSGQGLTHAAIAGMMLPALIAGERRDWSDVYAPSRGDVKAAIRTAVEQVGALVGIGGDDEVEPPNGPQDARELQPGAGAVIGQGDDAKAVWRDDDGRLHKRAAACTHAGCTVAWNGFERCWDCPCHGSHFATDGEAINGPAVEPLPAA